MRSAECRMSGGKCQTRDEADGVGEGVRTRAGEGGLRFDRLEMGGALGDLGTFIPLLAAMVKTCALPLAPALFFAGLMNVATGFLFRIPMAVQPMKAIATVAIAEGLNVRQILAAGLATSLVLLALTLLGLVDLLNRSLPRSVVRGLQLALGLKLLTTGIRFIADTDAWWGWDSIAMGVVCAGVVLAFYFSRRVPAALVVFLLGLGAMFMATDGLLDKLYLGFAPPKFWLKEIAPGEWGVGILKGAVPQLPLTLLNSVIAVCALSCDLFPRRPAAPRRVAAWRFVGRHSLAGRRPTARLDASGHREENPRALPVVGVRASSGVDRIPQDRHVYSRARELLRPPRGGYSRQAAADLHLVPAGRLVQS